MHGADQQCRSVDGMTWLRIFLHCLWERVYKTTISALSVVPGQLFLWSLTLNIRRWQEFFRVCIFSLWLAQIKTLTSEFPLCALLENSKETFLVWMNIPYFVWCFINAQGYAESVQHNTNVLIAITYNNAHIKVALLLRACLLGVGKV